MRILVVEDNQTLAGGLAAVLRGSGYAVDVVGDGASAVAVLATERFDLVILDLNLPQMDGLEVLRTMRGRQHDAAVLILSARHSLDERVKGLDLGADDYMVKPFAFAELLARLRALVRRGTVERPPVIEVGDLRLDPGTRQVWRGETEIDLSSKEFTLLETFMRHAGYVLSRAQLLEQAWEYDFEHRSNVVEVYIRYLRRKIDVPFDVTSIETVRGAGYRLRKDGGR